MEQNPQIEKKEDVEIEIARPQPIPKCNEPPKQPQQKEKQKKQKKKPLCSRCKDPRKSVKKHHYPLGSGRMAFLCDHCYNVVKKQRKRAKKFGHW